MSETEARRQKAISDSDQYGSKRRFALFSHPISNAVGDNGQYQSKIHPRDPAMNQPITQPRNFVTTPMKTGKVNSAYFTGLTTLASSPVKDEFVEPARRQQKEEYETRKKGKKNEVSFFTGAGNKIISTPSYPYVEQKNPEVDTRKNRDEDGRVKSQPKNFYTNQTSTIEKGLFKQYEHVADPYNRAHELERESKKKQKSFQIQQNFKPNSFCPSPFQSNKSVYKPAEFQKKEIKELKLNIYKHEMAWKTSSPNKKGIYGYLAPFPEYKENPPKLKQAASAREKTKQAFKLSSPQVLSAPTPSISMNRSNLIRSTQTT